ncbi:MAG: hypothetical protein Fur009_3370 [Candidatus Microgenomates bacterium]
MTFQNSFKTEAFVLKKKPLLNKDLLVFLFTKNRGKVLVFGKGVRKITSRRQSFLETGNLIDIVLEKRNEIYYIKEVILISGFYNIKSHKNKINLIYQLFFVLDKILPENQKEEAVYNLIKSFFIKINQNNSNNKLIYQFINKILISLGYLKQEVDESKIDEIFFELTNEKIPTFII